MNVKSSFHFWIFAIAIMLLIPSVVHSEDAPLFHVVAAADSVTDTETYVGGSVATATDALGAPSATWFNPTDQALIDYIYVGQSVVLTFQVSKEGKTVSHVLSEARSSWENGGCRAYPKCPTIPAG